jgi:hypothetical protein
MGANCGLCGKPSRKVSLKYRIDSALEANSLYMAQKEGFESDTHFCTECYRLNTTASQQPCRTEPRTNDQKQFLLHAHPIGPDDGLDTQVLAPSRRRRFPGRRSQYSLPPGCYGRSSSSPSSSSPLQPRHSLEMQRHRARLAKLLCRRSAGEAAHPSGPGSRRSRRNA